MESYEVQGAVDRAIDARERGVRNRRLIGEAMNYSFRRWLGTIIVMPLIVGVAFGIVGGLLTDAATGVIIGLVMAGFIEVFTIPIFALWVLKQLYKVTLGKIFT